MSKLTAISRVFNDNKFTFTGKIVDGEVIAAGAGTVSFERLNLTKEQFEALSLDEDQRQFFQINKDLLDQRNRITNIVTVSGDTMPAGSTITVSLYSRVSGLFHTITETLDEVLDGEFLLSVIEAEELNYADYFSITYGLAQGSEYTADIELVVSQRQAITNTGEIVVSEGAVEGPKSITTGIPQDFTAGWVDLGAPINTSSLNQINLFLKLVANDSQSLQIRALGKLTSGSADEYPFQIETVSSAKIAIQDEYVEFTNDADQNVIIKILSEGVPFIQLQIKTGTVGATAGQVTGVDYTLKEV